MESEETQGMMNYSGICAGCKKENVFWRCEAHRCLWGAFINPAVGQVEAAQLPSQPYVSSPKASVSFFFFFFALYITSTIIVLCAAKNRNKNIRTHNHLCSYTQIGGICWYLTNRLFVFCFSFVILCTRTPPS